MHVRVNSIYRVQRCLLDIADSRTDLRDGDIVRVVNLPGCPRANVMRHCHVANPLTGEFIGLVCTSSLEPASAATKRHVRRIATKR
jgi:hypothetical protein